MATLIYARVSTDMQTTDMQVQMCKALAKEHGDNNPCLFIDQAVSAKIPMDKRPQLQAFLDAICENDLVIVYDLDRIGRDLIEGATIYDEIKDLGAKLTSVTDRNCDNPFIVHIKMSVAQEELRKIGEKTRNALKAKQNNFEKVGQVWYGYELDQNIIQTKERARTEGKPYKLIPNPHEQEAISIMKSMRAEGHAFGKIVDALTERGYLTRVGTPFAKMTVKRILDRELNHPALKDKTCQLALQ